MTPPRVSRWPKASALLLLCLATSAAAAEPALPAEARILALLAPETAINPTDVSVADARAAVAARPENADLWNRLGEALRVSGDVEGAVEAYQKATRLPPKDIGRAYLHRDLAEALEQTGDLAGALAAARTSVRTWPKSREGLFCGGAEERLLVRLLVKNGDLNGALSFYRPLAAADPEQPDCADVLEALEAARR